MTLNLHKGRQNEQRGFWGKRKKKTINLVFLQEFKFNCDIATQPFVFLSMDLIVMLSHLDADHGCCVSGAQTQLFQIGPIGIKFEPACKHKSSSLSHAPTATYISKQRTLNRISYLAFSYSLMVISVSSMVLLTSVSTLETKKFMAPSRASPFLHSNFCVSALYPNSSCGERRKFYLLDLL